MSFTTWKDAELEAELLGAINLDAPWATVERFSTLIRTSGSAEEREAVDYLIARLTEWGVPHTLYEPVCFVSMPISATLREDRPGGRTFRAKTSAMSVPTNGVELSGELVYIPPAEQTDQVDDWSVGIDFRGVDVRGKVVIVDGMSAPARVLDSQNAGALAGIYINPGEYIHEGICTSIWGTPDLDHQDRQPAIPVLGVNQADGQALIELAKAGGRVAFSTEVETGWKPIPVLVADIPGAVVPDRFALLHGHIDSWHVGVGDNAVGDATMLELARVFWEKRDKLVRSVRIAWWSGHSHGRYAGSTWYADEFGIELARGCIAQINCDSPGCRWADTFNELTCMSEAEALVDSVVRETTGITPQTERPLRAGDYSFNQIGISSFFMLSSTMSQAARDQKGYYPVGGCGANIAWHSEDDTIEIADRDNLLRDMRVYAAAVLRVVNSPSLPFDWRATTAEMRGTLARYQDAAGDDFDFGPANEALDNLDAALDRLYANPPTGDPADPAARRFNRAQKELARILVPVNFTRASAFHHDSTYEPSPLPDIAPATSIPAARGDVHAMGVLKAHLTRGRNRLVWSLESARDVVERATN